MTDSFVQFIRESRPARAGSGDRLKPPEVNQRFTLSVLILLHAFFIIEITVKAVVCPLKMGKGMEF